MSETTNAVSYQFLYWFIESPSQPFNNMTFILSGTSLKREKQKPWKFLTLCFLFTSGDSKLLEVETILLHPDIPHSSRLREASTNV